MYFSYSYKKDRSGNPKSDKTANLIIIYSHKRWLCKYKNNNNDEDNCHKFLFLVYVLSWHMTFQGGGIGRRVQYMLFNVQSPFVPILVLLSHVYPFRTLMWSIVPHRRWGTAWIVALEIRVDWLKHGLLGPWWIICLLCLQERSRPVTHCVGWRRRQNEQVALLLLYSLDKESMWLII